MALTCMDNLHKCNSICCKQLPFDKRKGYVVKAMKNDVIKIPTRGLTVDMKYYYKLHGAVLKRDCQQQTKPLLQKNLHIHQSFLSSPSNSFLMMGEKSSGINPSGQSSVA